MSLSIDVDVQEWGIARQRVAEFYDRSRIIAKSGSFKSEISNASNHIGSLNSELQLEGTQTQAEARTADHH